MAENYSEHPHYNDFTIIKLRGLPWDITADKIYNFFKSVQLLNDGVFIQTNALERPSGKGFVEFVDNYNAKMALEMNKQKIDHRWIELFISNQKERSRAYSIPRIICDYSKYGINENVTVIKMNGLPRGTNEDQVIAFFAPLNVSNVHLIRNHLDQVFREGYVEFINKLEGIEAMKKNGGPFIEGGPLELLWSSPRELALVLARLDPDVSDNTFLLEMEGLPFDSNEEDVIDFFDQDLSLIKVHFVTNLMGKAAGIAFAEFRTQQARTTALKKKNQEIGGRYIELKESTAEELKMRLMQPKRYGRKWWKNSKAKKKKKKMN